ncbi:hypothetical protein GPECTOR_36g23 [Gonium pectorale]|uniref:arginyltransferase n=1 Tax=Gonium pectorale TaxID=33097 RepID=A0A150GBR6_GONPE|nr:hypothetical protein GPECTOR_36g23 [Gonium pectorale]|eukprot:KXZ47297.1 hypothetical protein GPECTOR_36g23 [Gonium pectorale]
MPVKSLTVYQYQDLIDQGWRRSGTYLYKPVLEHTCCKAYTIRLDATQFAPDKGQRRLLRKWRAFLAGQVESSQFNAEAGDEQDTPMEDVEPQATAGSAQEGPPASNRRGQQQHQPGRQLHIRATQSPPARATAPVLEGAVTVAGAEGRVPKPVAGAGWRERAMPLLDRVLAAALSAAVAGGALPPSDYPAPSVRLVTDKQRHALPADVHFTSAAAFALAAAAARQGKGGGGPTGAPAAKAAEAEPPAVRAADVHAAMDASPGAAVAARSAEGETQTAAATGAKPGAKQCRRKAASPQDGPLRAQHLAETLAQHFNAILIGSGGRGGTEEASGGQAAAGAAAPPAGGPAMEIDGGAAAPGQAGPVRGEVAASGRDAAASLLALCAAEAYAASGHINLRARPSGAESGQGPTGAARRDAGAPVGGTGAGVAPGCTGDGGAERRRSGGGGVSVPGDVAAHGGAAGAAADGAGGSRSGGSSTKSTKSIKSTKSSKRPHTDGGCGGSAQAGRTGAAGAELSAGGSRGGASAAALAPPAAPARGGAAGAAADPAEALAVPTGRLEVRLVPSEFSEEEYRLYERYQVVQHHDDPEELSREAFKRFLVESPLRPVGRAQDPGAPADCGYGSFHQQYWLDGKLIAVGVVDVLPRCLSSVYLFWDPELPSLALGRFTALQEIRWVLQHVAASPSLRYYYMGFYIHTCPKMRYKADYRPSDLLCPRRKVWVRITPELLRAVEQQPYLELSAQPGALCQPNLAAPPGDPAAAAAAGAPAAGPEQPAGQGLQAGAAGGAGGGGKGGGGAGGVGDTLLLLPGRWARQGPVRFEAVRRAKLFAEETLQMLEEHIAEWRAAVGWTAPQLVYQL